MEKQTKISFLFFGLMPISIILHNLIFALTSTEEAFFFFLVLISAVGFFVSVVWNTITYLRRGEPRDIWKLGFLGFFGIFGLIGLPGIYGLFGLYGFFGAKNWRRAAKK